MYMPGFTAEASLDKTGQYYRRMLSLASAQATEVIRPAQRCSGPGVPVPNEAEFYDCMERCLPVGHYSGCYSGCCMKATGTKSRPGTPCCYVP